MGFRIWLILKLVTPVVSLLLSLCRWSWNFFGFFVCFVFWQKDEQEFRFTYLERTMREETFVW